MIDASMLNCPGPRSVFRPVLPKLAVVSLVWTKQDVLYQRSMVGLLRTGSQIWFGRFVTPVDSMLCVCVRLTIGSPVRRYNSPFSCHPPHARCAAHGSS